MILNHRKKEQKLFISTVQLRNSKHKFKETEMIVTMLSLPQVFLNYRAKWIFGPKSREHEQDVPAKPIKHSLRCVILALFSFSFEN